MKNKGFMLFETLIASTVILGTLIFLYAQFSAIKRTYSTIFKYNTIPNLYEAKTFASFLENDGYALYINELNSTDKGYLNINACRKSRSSLCRKLLNNMDVKYILFVSDNISTLQNDLTINNYDKTIFTEDFKNFILTIDTVDNQGRYRLIISFNDGTFASIPIGVSNADEQKTEYTVNHYLMNLDGETYTLKDSEELTWFNGYEITPAVNNYVGFTSPQATTTLLSKDNNVINYYYERNKYNVTITGDDHVISTDALEEYYYGQEISINTELEVGYDIDSISGDINSLDFTMPANDITANIKTKIGEYKVTFDSNGGNEAISPANISVVYGTEYGELPTPTRTGYNFLGWYTATSGGTLITSSSIATITSNQTLYAIWEPDTIQSVINQEEQTTSLTS